MFGEPRLSRPAVCLALLAAACSGGTPHPASSGASPTPTMSTASPSGPASLITSLPVACTESSPGADATVAFVAQGRAWAATPGGAGLTCLFDAPDPGPFLWGPRADRVALGGLAVKGVGSRATRPPGSTEPTTLSWGRPTGLAIVFVDSTGRHLEKAAVGSTRITDISDLEGATYADVVYHPSGLAIAFVDRRSGSDEITMSSNTGAQPKRLVFTNMGTRFGPLAFDPGGVSLYYGARLRDGTSMLAAYDLNTGVSNEHLWQGREGVLTILPSPAGSAGAVLDVGSGCADRRALFTRLNGDSGSPLLPDAGGPTTALGWLGPGQVLVAEGGCTGPIDLFVVTIGVGPADLLVRGVDRAAVRVPEPTPPPALPDIGVPSGFA